MLALLNLFFLGCVGVAVAGRRHNLVDRWIVSAHRTYSVRFKKLHVAEIWRETGRDLKVREKVFGL